MIREKQLWSSLASANSAQLRRICLKSNINLTLAYLNEVHLEKQITMLAVHSVLFCQVKKNTLLMQHTCFVSGGILYMISALYLLKKIVQFIVTNVYGSLCKKHWCSTLASSQQSKCIHLKIRRKGQNNNVVQLPQPCKLKKHFAKMKMQYTSLGNSFWTCS